MVRIRDRSGEVHRWFRTLYVVAVLLYKKQQVARPARCHGRHYWNNPGTRQASHHLPKVEGAADDHITREHSSTLRRPKPNRDGSGPQNHQRHRQPHQIAEGKQISQGVGEKARCLHDIQSLTSARLLVLVLMTSICIHMMHRTECLGPAISGSLVLPLARCLC